MAFVDKNGIEHREPDQLDRIADLITAHEQLDRIEAKLDKLLAPKKRKPRTVKGKEYSDWFESMWREYPKRAGSNPKGKAADAVQARWKQEIYGKHPTLTTKERLDEAQKRIELGVMRYADFCKATGKTGTEYVMQAATFFGPDKHYENDWSIPKPKEKNGQPEIFSQSHQDADFSGQAEKALDPVDPYAELK